MFLSKDQVSFRSMEVRMDCCFKLLLLVFAIIKFASNLGLMIWYITTGGIINTFLYGLQLLFLTTTFTTLVQLVRKHHSPQYIIQKKSLFLYFLGTFLFCLVSGLNCILSVSGIKNSNLTGYGLNAQQFQEFCQSDKTPIQIFNDFCFLLLTQLHIFDVFNAYIVVFVKNQEDILAGYNKLDSLMKVSIFQNYKDRSREDDKINLFISDRTNLRLLNGTVSGSSSSSVSLGSSEVFFSRTMDSRNTIQKDEEF